jgi:hypothetical protein
MFSIGDTCAKNSWATRQGKKNARAAATARASINQIQNEDFPVDTLKYCTKRCFLQAYQYDRLLPGFHEPEKGIIMEILNIAARSLLATGHIVYLVAGAIDCCGLELTTLDPAVVHRTHTNAFIAYVIGYTFIEILPNLAKVAWSLFKMVRGMLH